VPRLVTLLGRVTEARLEHPEKALQPMVLSSDGRVIEGRLVHPLKAQSPIVWRVLGRVTYCSCLQFLKTEEVIAEILSGMTTESSPHCAKAAGPIVSSKEGRSTEVRLEQLRKA